MKALVKVVILAVYQLNTSKVSQNLLLKYSGQCDKIDEKIGKNMYLKRSHYRFLDDLADHRDVSRNQALRDILDKEMSEYQ